jgi:ABC-type bacteriocin/lantibiotic exporter with double-glycine peptidase domain
MEDLIAAVIGIVLMLAFAGALAWMIGSPPLLIIIGGVLLMAVLDVVRTLREQAGNAQS